MFEPWNGWTPKDGDYNAEYDTPKQSLLQLLISTKLAFNTTYAVISLAILVVILNLAVKI